jgi:GDP-D-mannose 3', 5'-epimerase
LNLGTDRLISINGLVDLISRIAGKRLTKHHDLSKPQGVRGRNSDNSRLRQTLGWEPSVALEQGLTATYHWIENELRQAGRLPNIYTARSAD